MHILSKHEAAVIFSQEVTMAEAILLAGIKESFTKVNFPAHFMQAIPNVNEQEQLHVHLTTYKLVRFSKVL